MMRWLALLGWAGAAGAVLWGCAAAPPGRAPAATTAVPSPAPAGPSASSPAPTASAAGARYRCDQGMEFTVRFSDDIAYIDSPKRGSEVALRDAGGVTPQQSVYSNTHLRAEFGLGAAGREAQLHYPPDPQAVRCVRE